MADEGAAPRLSLSSTAQGNRLENYFPIPSLDIKSHFVLCNFHGTDNGTLIHEISPDPLKDADIGEVYRAPCTIACKVGSLLVLIIVKLLPFLR